VIDFEWYRSFVSIYRHNSVSEAAKARFMTQPAMSRHLASLEAEVGEKLFIRMARKMIPTERGKLLYSEVAPLVEALEKVSADIRTSSRPDLKWIKIGSAPDFYQEKILRLVGEGAGMSVVPTRMLEGGGDAKVRIVYGNLSVRNELFFAYRSKHRYFPEIQHAMRIIRGHI